MLVDCGLSKNKGIKFFSFNVKEKAIGKFGKDLERRALSLFNYCVEELGWMANEMGS